MYINSMAILSSVFRPTMYLLLIVVIKFFTICKYKHIIESRKYLFRMIDFLFLHYFSQLEAMLLHCQQSWRKTSSYSLHLERCLLSRLLNNVILICQQK